MFNAKIGKSLIEIVIDGFVLLLVSLFRFLLFVFLLLNFLFLFDFVDVTSSIIVEVCKLLKR